MTTYWYALQSKPRKEELLAEQLEARQIEAFCPEIRVQVVNPRARKVKPYFPGYLFVHVDLERVGRSAFQYVPGASSLVSFGGTATAVPENLIGAIRRRVDEINTAGGELFETLKKGETVLIQDGPFAGYEAIFDARLPGSDRVRVLLTLLSQRQMPVELPAGEVCLKK